MGVINGRYPRTVENSMRKENNKRKDKREESKKKKEAEKQKQKEELNRLKALKRKEINEKVERLRKIAGKNDMNFEGDDLDEDFDPEKHDKRMEELFGDYDNVEVDFNEDEKPEFSDLEDDPELVPDNWDGYDGQESDDDDEDDDDDGRGKEQKSAFERALKKPKPAFKGEKGSEFQKYLNEYYKVS